MIEFLIKAAVICSIVCILAYFVPGLALRAIQDFKKRIKGGGTNGKS